MEKREAYAPWSLTRKAGVQSATVNGDIEVPQFIQPVLDTGFVDELGNWKGIKSSDESFFISDTAEGIANGWEVLFPNTADRDFIDMTGYTDLLIAILPTNGGNVATTAVMGPDSHSYANLSPVNPASTLMTNGYPQGAYHSDFEEAFNDGAQSLTANVWNIFLITEVLKSQKLLQFKIVNNSGGASDIDFAYLRLV